MDVNYFCVAALHVFVLSNPAATAHQEERAAQAEPSVRDTPAHSSTPRKPSPVHAAHPRHAAAAALYHHYNTTATTHQEAPHERGALVL